MFIVEKITTIERYCPDGHTPVPDLPQSNNLRFCPICGASIEEHQTTYDAALCANCNNRVCPTWNYCPYCGRAREE